jgi:hypothetical protein
MIMYSIPQYIPNNHVLANKGRRYCVLCSGQQREIFRQQRVNASDRPDMLSYCKETRPKQCNETVMVTVPVEAQAEVKLNAGFPQNPGGHPIFIPSVRDRLGNYSF